MRRDVAGDLYLLLGSLSGTSPGTPLPGGLVLPLNLDGLLNGMATFPNLGVFVDTFGVVGVDGRASSSLVVPPGLLLPALIGLELNFANVYVDGTGFAVEISNVATFFVTP